MTPTHLSRRERTALWLEGTLDRWLGRLGVALYRLTRGRLTRPWRVNVLVLTTRGRRTGKVRDVLLQFFWAEGVPLVLAANAGRPRHPAWYHNLLAAPAARVQIMARTLTVRPERLPPGAAQAFWPHILRVAPVYGRYRKATQREMPMVRLVPSGPDAGSLLPLAAGPPPTDAKHPH